MTKKKALLFIVILALTGSFIMFYMTNLILSDVSNMFYGVHDAFFITSLPGFSFACEFIAVTMFVFRMYSHPQYRKRTVRLYCSILIFFSVIGLASTVVSKLVYYKGCRDIYPFKGYLICFALTHVVMIALGIVSLVRSKALPDDSEKRRVTPWYVLYTVIMVLVIFFAYDRFGALLWAPVYVHLRTLYLTVWFYISLLLPVAVLLQYVFFEFGVYESHPKLETVYMISVLVADVVLAVVVCTIGAKNTQFVSAISPALAIERLATKPIDTILHFALVFVFGSYNLINSLRYRKKKKAKSKQAPSAE